MQNKKEKQQAQIWTSAQCSTHYFSLQYFDNHFQANRTVQCALMLCSFWGIKHFIALLHAFIVPFSLKEWHKGEWVSPNAHCTCIHYTLQLIIIITVDWIHCTIYHLYAPAILFYDVMCLPLTEWGSREGVSSKWNAYRDKAPESDIKRESRRGWEGKWK